MDTSYLETVKLPHGANNLVNNEVPNKNDEQWSDEYFMPSVSSESIQQEAELTTSESIADNQLAISVVAKIKEEPGVIVNTSEFSNTLASCEFKLECDADDSNVIDYSYTCDVGGKELSLNSATHHYTGQKSPHRCDDCGQTFKKKYALTRHYRIHTGEKPFSCNVCGKSFRRNDKLAEHNRRHNGEKQFKCDVCGKGLCKSVEKPYECDICGKAFRVRVHLKNHHLSHTGENPGCDEDGENELYPKIDLPPKSSSSPALSSFTTALGPGEIKLNTISICNSDFSHCFWDNNEYYSCKDIFTFIGAQKRVDNRGYAFILKLLPPDLTNRNNCFVVFKQHRFIRKDLIMYLCKHPSFFPEFDPLKRTFLRSLLAGDTEVKEPESQSVPYSDVNLAPSAPASVVKENDTDIQFKPRFIVQEGKMFIDLPSALKQAGMYKHVAGAGYINIERHLCELGFTNVKACFLYRKDRTRNRSHIWIFAFMMLLKHQHRLGSSDLKERLYRDLLLWLEGKALLDNITVTQVTST